MADLRYNEGVSQGGGCQMPWGPEDKARQKIGTMLDRTGWFLQNLDAFDLSVGRGIVSKYAYFVTRGGNRVV